MMTIDREMKENVEYSLALFSPHSIWLLMHPQPQQSSVEFSRPSLSLTQQLPIIQPLLHEITAGSDAPTEE